MCFDDPESLAGGCVASGRCSPTGKINGEIPDQRAVTYSPYSAVMTRTCVLCTSQWISVDLLRHNSVVIYCIILLYNCPLPIYIIRPEKMQK